jgi:hypothetical protein
MTLRTLAAATCLMACTATSSFAATTNFDVTLTQSSSTWDRVWPAEGVLSSETGTFFETTDFSVDTSGLYDILSNQDFFDGMIFVYETSFDPLSQFTNYLDGDDDFTRYRDSFIEDLQLNVGTDYVLVSGAYSAGDFGTHSYTITGPGTASISAVPLPAGGLLLLSGFGGVAALKRRKTRAA